MEALIKQRDGADGHALAAGFTRNQGSRRGVSVGHLTGRDSRGGAHERRDGRHDGR